jgi:hypothetical protein
MLFAANRLVFSSMIRMKSPHWSVAGCLMGRHFDSEAVMSGQQREISCGLGVINIRSRVEHRPD